MMANKVLISYLLLVGLCTMISELTAAIGTRTSNKYPFLSQQNMPKTDFSCRDKILGGYYADAETQCQMFHICVKVAGVGIQDFRFLCPNGTAFDQEAQTCADFGDVNCEQATLYFGSDNFDLYRIGSSFDKKVSSIPAAEEESTFHLQRAESNDIRRSKESLLIHTKPYFGYNEQKIDTNSVKPAKQYQPIRSTTLPPPTTTIAPTTTIRYHIPERYIQSTTTTTTTAQPYLSTRLPPQPKSLANNNDEIFKGSHSSNFYSNRNRNDDDDDFKRSSAVPSKTRHQQRSRGRTQYRGTPAPPLRIATPTTTTTTRPYALNILQTSTNLSAFTANPTTYSPFRFSFTSTVRSTPSAAIVSSTPLGPLQQKYQQTNYNNNFGNFRAATTSIPSATQQNLANNPFSTPSIYSVVSSPAPFNANANTFNKIPIQQKPAINGTFAKQPAKPFDNHNLINNYQTTSPFANNQPFLNNNNNQVFFSGAINTNATTKLVPTPSNSLLGQTTLSPFNSFGTGNLFPSTNSNQFLVTSTTVKTTTSSPKPRATLKYETNNFQQPDFLKDFSYKQQQPQQQLLQAQPPPQLQRSHQLQQQPQYQQQSQFPSQQQYQPQHQQKQQQQQQQQQQPQYQHQQKQQQPQYQHQHQQQQQPQQQAQQSRSQTNRQFIDLTAEQKRLQLHFDINDYLTTDKYSTPIRFTSTSEHYQSTNAQTKKPVESATDKSHFITTTAGKKAYVDLFRYQTQQDRPAQRVQSQPLPPQQLNQLPQQPQQQQQQQQQQQPLSFVPLTNERNVLAVKTAQLAQVSRQTAPIKEHTSEATNNNIPTVKKFSTLVPKESYYTPTTFKPSFYFNVAKQINDNLSTPNKGVPSAVITPSTPSVLLAAATTTTIRPSFSPTSGPHRLAEPIRVFNLNQPQTKIAPTQNATGIDENDGQYHPELYEKDFARFKIKSRKKQHQQIQSKSQFNNYQRNLGTAPANNNNNNNNNDDEFLNTAFSQNIAASGNELFNAKSQAAQKAQSKTTIKPVSNANKANGRNADDKDVSYDYAYYDSANDTPHDYSDLDFTEFSKTRGQRKQ